MKKLSIVLLISVMSFVLFSCGSSEDEPTAALTFDTKGGYTAEVLTDCPLDYATATATTIKKLVPNSDTSKLAPQDCQVTEYSDGMKEIYFGNITVDGNEFGGTIYLTFSDDDQFQAHYLQVANKEYLNDGIDLTKYDEK